jgi:hypothetical protein
MSGGKNIFELIYERPVKLDYNIQRILLECIVYDSDLEADFIQLKEGSSGTKDKYTIQPKKGIKEIMYEVWLQEQYPKWVNAEITFLTSKEYGKIGQSSDYYRNITPEDTAWGYSSGRETT